MVKEKYFISKEKLYNLYYKDTLTLQEISKKLNVSYSFIQSRFKKLGIPLRRFGYHFKNKTWVDIIGKENSLKKKQKMSERMSKIMLNENNPQWKGNEVGYNSLHQWINTHKPKLKFCEECKKKKPYDLANISGEYKRDINDFEWLCRGCHMKKDGRINNLKKGAEKGKNNPNWQGGIQYEPYDKKFNNIFKRRIRKRDNQICMLCEIHREKLKRALDVHHIDYNKLMSIPQNCISLCRKCHAKTQVNRKHWIKFFQSLLSEKYNYKYSDNREVILNFVQNY